MEERRTDPLVRFWKKEATARKRQKFSGVRDDVTLPLLGSAENYNQPLRRYELNDAVAALRGGADSGRVKHAEANSYARTRLWRFWFGHLPEESVWGLTFELTGGRRPSGGANG